MVNFGEGEAAVEVRERVPFEGEEDIGAGVGVVEGASSFRTCLGNFFPRPSILGGVTVGDFPFPWFLFGRVTRPRGLELSPALFFFFG